MAEKSKPCEIYRRMFDVNKETCFSHKMFTNGVIWLCHNESESKRQSMEWKHTLK